MKPTKAIKGKAGETHQAFESNFSTPGLNREEVKIELQSGFCWLISTAFHFLFKSALKLITASTKYPDRQKGPRRKKREKSFYQH